MIDRPLGIVRLSALAWVSSSWEPGKTIVRSHDQQDIEFIYRASRPFEVKMTVAPENTWLFDREIIFEGLEPDGCGGLGDVQVYNDSKEFAYMRLDSQEGWCVLKFRLGQMRTFAREMQMLIPRGEESMNMDLVIAEIFEKEA